MDNTIARRHDAEVAEGFLAPLEEGEALFVPSEFDFFVLILGVFSPSDIDLDRVINYEISLAKRVNFFRITTKFLHSSPHSGKVNDGGHTGEVLKEDTGGLEGDLDVLLRGGLPIEDRLNIRSYTTKFKSIKMTALRYKIRVDKNKSNKESLTLNIEVVAVPDGGLEENTDRVGKLLIALVAESGEREVLVGLVIDGEVTDLSLGEGVCLGSLNHSLSFCDLWWRRFLYLSR